MPEFPFPLRIFNFFFVVATVYRGKQNVRKLNHFEAVRINIVRRDPDQMFVTLLQNVTQTLLGDKQRENV